MMGKRGIYILVCSVALFVLSVAPVSAQHYVGVRGGWGGGFGRFYPKPDESGSVWGLYHGGISWKYYSPERSVGGVEVDILFMQQGYRNYDLSYVPENSDEKARRLSYYQRTVNSIMIPAYWQSHAYLFQRKMRVFLNLGVTFSYNFSSWEEFHSYENPQEDYSRDYPMQLNRDNPLGFGLAGGFGMGWSFGRCEIVAEGRYYFGYGDILRNRNKYELNPMRSPLDDVQASLGVYWRLGKGGILAPAGPKLAAKLKEIEDRRAEEQLRKEIDRTNKEAERIIKEGDSGAEQMPEGQPGTDNVKSQPASPAAEAPVKGADSEPDMGSGTVATTEKPDAASATK